MFVKFGDHLLLSMKKLTYTNILPTIGLMLMVSFKIYGASHPNSKSITLENQYMKRAFSIVNGSLKTDYIVNKRNNNILRPLHCSEFRLRISNGTHIVGTDETLTTSDFMFTESHRYKINKNVQGISFTLINKEKEITIVAHYELGKEDFFMRKYLVIRSGKPITLERIDIEAITFEDAYQPYVVKEINSKGKWSPGLGQPLFTKQSGTFWGVEFPAASNEVIGQQILCGYLWGRELNNTKTYTTYKGVVGVTADHEFIDDTFYEYIDRTRVRPFHVQIQYNTWFDYGKNINREKFRESLETINRELVIKRGCRPLNAYVIDDGWQDSFATSDWSDTVWKTNNKFDTQFRDTKKSVQETGSTLGLWLSPGCFFGARPMVPKLREAGYEALANSMSMSGPKYMDKLEDRIIQLTRQGVSYFKFDGLFGHLHIRDFELTGKGAPYMPQLDSYNFIANDERLNNHEYDEAKTYYLVAGTERLISIFDKISFINPDVFISITNGAYLSPWWLQHVDLVWLINSGDAAGGSTRTEELIYRDHVYHTIWREEQTKFPMYAVFNHEPKKTETGESREAFKKYLFMNLSRGTSFVELYIKTKVLSSDDWDILAEGLKWVYTTSPAFKRVRMHGGNPKDGEVYGYSGWTSDLGYISFHNPSDSIKTYSIVLNRKCGLTTDNNRYSMSALFNESLGALKNYYNFGDTLTLSLKPKEILILGFTKK